jgi:hypothetical protein
MINSLAAAMRLTQNLEYFCASFGDQEARDVLDSCTNLQLIARDLLDTVVSMM